MKYLFFSTVFLFGSFFVVQKILADNHDIIINEIGAYASSSHEWIEIWNKGNESIDIKDWKFWENNTNHGLKAVSSSDSFISPNEYGVIAQDSEEFLRDYPDFIGSVFDSSWGSLNESGEEIGLKDEAGNFVEQFVYVSTTKFSLERKDPFLNDYSASNWQENLNGNTVGAKNSNSIAQEEIVLVDTSTQNFISDSVTTSSSQLFFDWPFIKLNEIISNPTNGNEMVELFNNSSSTLDISGGFICDSTQSNCKILSGSIFSNDWLVVDLLTDRYLNNDSDTVFLEDQNNNIVDQIVYGGAVVAAQKEQSLIRKVDGQDSDSDIDWSVTDKITLGAKNELFLNDTVPAQSNGGGQMSYGENIIEKKSASIINNSKSTSASSSTQKKDPVKIFWQLKTPYGLDVGEEGIFNARGTADPRGGEINFIWNFGDNTSSTGHLLGHSYATSGVFVGSVSASSTSGTFGENKFIVYVGKTFSTVLSDVKISNWIINGGDDVPEYIELKNNLDNKQNISSWKLRNKSGKEYVFPDKTVMPAAGTLKFFKTITHLVFDKNDDVISLLSPDGQTIDRVFLKTLAKVSKLSVKKSVSNKRIATSVIKGTVTVGPGVFGSQFFYINDGQNIFQIYQYKKDFPELKIGDFIQVVGEPSLVEGVKRIKIKTQSDIDILSTNNDLPIKHLSLIGLNSSLLGEVVKLSGDITEIKNNYFYLDDGESEILVYFFKGTNVKLVDFKEGDKIEVIGILDKDKNGWRILPRSNEDLKKIENDQNKAMLDIENSTTVNKNKLLDRYLSATAGGVTTLLLSFLARTRGAAMSSSLKKGISLALKAIKRG